MAEIRIDKFLRSARRTIGLEITQEAELIVRARENLIQWYTSRAYEKIRERVERYSKITGLPYASIKISNSRKRLGSCSFKGRLNFSWRLIMAPLAIIDYVVVHELTHLDELNHSSRFWNKVKAVLPDYKGQEAWLKNNQCFSSLDQE